MGGRSALDPRVLATARGAHPSLGAGETCLFFPGLSPCLSPSLEHTSSASPGNRSHSPFKLPCNSFWKLSYLSLSILFSKALWMDPCQPSTHPDSDESLLPITARGNPSRVGTVSLSSHPGAWLRACPCSQQLLLNVSSLLFDAGAQNGKMAPESWGWNQTCALVQALPPTIMAGSLPTLSAPQEEWHRLL